MPPPPYRRTGTSLLAVLVLFLTLALGIYYHYDGWFQHFPPGETALHRRFTPNDNQVAHQPLQNVSSNPQSDHILDRRQTTSTDPADGYACSVDAPCSNGACCGISGICGYGPTYCGDGCSSNCDAKAECGQYSADGVTTCPLNVCCSQWGFCGTTSDFCDTGCQSNCGYPADPGSGGDVRDLVIGYYESWKASGTECGIMDPSQIPVEALNQVNFAFVYIMPDTYDLYPMTGDWSVLKRVAALNSENPDTKVWISIGGWAFSDNDTDTQAVFGEIASSDTNSAAFATKVVSFLTEYGFSGVDIDWEYPGAPDRGGQDRDVDNYARMLGALRTAFDNVGRGWGISITVPTSYWYLRWFNLPAINDVVDYFNLMAYDLHGVWDSTDPIGPYIYGHTNLTEIDLALDLFWRVPIDPSRINLGLAFYGRSFLLTTPSCIEPGCSFTGPGVAGSCTQTAGILSFREIENIQSGIAFDDIHDSVAAVNYMSYWQLVLADAIEGDVIQTSWVSYDNKQTYQQKIDFANSHGLHGIFIWAIDQDDDSLTALKAVTGKDIAAVPGESSVITGWDLGMCTITGCGQPCASGWTFMTYINGDAHGHTCPVLDDVEHQFCCPAWGAPNPVECRWVGEGPACSDTCDVDEVAMVYDVKGTNGVECAGGQATYCCPATGAAAAVNDCEESLAIGGTASCSSDYPQALTYYAYGNAFYSSPGTLTPYKALCCPAEPTFQNCAWHGTGPSCTDNRCPIGQITMIKDSSGVPNYVFGPTTSCANGLEKSFCCDAPYSEGALIPVPLEDLFYQTLPDADEPVYYEAFDHSADASPKFDSSNGDDPNSEIFSWTIMVGEAEDIQSLRRRDGSHLEAFECPDPHPDDYSTQEVKLVCMADDVMFSNCEDILMGGARGTIVRLPEDCGADEWVRVVSFRPLNAEDHPLPIELHKRAPENAARYRLRYDYNFRNLRRDGGEIYVRLDASFHPGYWEEIVESPHGKKREEQDWRAFHLDWFKRHGYIREDGTVVDEELVTPAHNVTPTVPLQARGYGKTGDLTWWRDRFSDLQLTVPTDVGFYGVTKEYQYSQVLYSASKSCPPYASASVEARVEGTFGGTLDFGITLIGALRNFDFGEAFAYFKLSDAYATLAATLEANAGISIQTAVTPLTIPLDPWGGAFNIKGLWVVGPYLDLTAQLQADAVISGTMTANATVITLQDYQWWYPQSMDVWPSTESYTAFFVDSNIKAGASANIASSGSLTMTLTPSLGFQVKLTALGQSLVNTDIKASFSQSITGRVYADSSCDGVQYALDGGTSLGITLANPFSAWSDGTQSYSVMNQTFNLNPAKCYSWSGDGTTTSKRDIYKRVDNTGPLFPDVLSSLITCPNGIDSDTGDCTVDVTQDNSDIFGSDQDSESNTKRDVDGNSPLEISSDIESKSLVIIDDEYEVDERLTSSRHHDPNAPRAIFKRSTKSSFAVCGSSFGHFVEFDGFSYPSSGTLRSRNPTTYSAPAKNAANCNVYTFGQVALPAAGTTAGYASEHILEYQMLKKFWTEFVAQYWTTTFANPAASTVDIGNTASIVGLCDYLYFWWGEPNYISYANDNGQVIAGTPATIISSGTIPSNGYWTDELTLLDKETNSFKERLFGDGVIRDATDMNNAITGNPNWAINNCKATMMALNYLKLPATAATFVTQATRVGTYLDDIESLLSQAGVNPSFNVQTYQILGLGDAWRSFIYTQATLANAKAVDFVNTYVPKLVTAHLNGGQSNAAIVTRVQALQAAANSWASWTNPLPATWG